jgi:hypothetical protein
MIKIWQAACKPNFVEDDHSSRRRITASAHSDLPAGLARRASTRAAAYAATLPAYLVLLRVGFTMPPTLQPKRCALTAPFHPYLTLADAAVYSLWHLPSRSLDAPVPDVIRHTALRSSDFPLPAKLFELPGSDRPAACQLSWYLKRNGSTSPYDEAFAELCRFRCYDGAVGGTFGRETQRTPQN